MKKVLISLSLLLASCHGQVRPHTLIEETFQELKTCKEQLANKPLEKISQYGVRHDSLYQSKYPELAYELLVAKRTEVMIEYGIDISDATDAFLNSFEYSHAKDSVIITIDSLLDLQITLLLKEIKL